MKNIALLRMFAAIEIRDHSITRYATHVAVLTVMLLCEICCPDTKIFKTVYIQGC